MVLSHKNLVAFYAAHPRIPNVTAYVKFLPYPPHLVRVFALNDEDPLVREVLERHGFALDYSCPVAKKSSNVSLSSSVMCRLTVVSTTLWADGVRCSPLVAFRV